MKQLLNPSFESFQFHAEQFAATRLVALTWAKDVMEAFKDRPIVGLDFFPAERNEVLRCKFLGRDFRIVHGYVPSTERQSQSKLQSIEVGRNFLSHELLQVKGSLAFDTTGDTAGESGSAAPNLTSNPVQAFLILIATQAMMKD